MHLFHVGWENDRLFLWGETSEVEFQVDKAGAGELTRACRTDTLVELLDEHGIAPQPESKKLVAWLPTVDEEAVPSSSVLGPDGTDRGRVKAGRGDDADTTLAPWCVPVVPLDRAAAVDLSGACHNRDMLAPGQLLGGDVANWSRVVRFAGALVAREQFLPGLQSHHGTYRARWEPVFVGEEAERLGTLVDATSPACRALSASKESPPDTAPRTVLLSVLGDLVDFIVRAGWHGQSFASSSDRTASSFDSLHAQWLHALCSTDGRMVGAEEDLEQLAGQVRAWRHRIEATTAAPFRLTFRLEEPEVPEDDEAIEGEPGPWHVRYLLQSTGDPSLQIEVAEAWDPDPSTARVFERADFQPGPYLLSALGQAMGVRPAIEESSWKKEANRFTPEFSVLVHPGSDRDQEEDTFVERVKDYTVVVTNHPLLRRDVELFRALSWDTVVLDEAFDDPDTTDAPSSAPRSAPGRRKLLGRPGSARGRLRPGGGSLHTRRPPEAAGQVSVLAGGRAARRGPRTGVPDRLDRRACCH